jgi:hypothetical protein
VSSKSPSDVIKDYSTCILTKKSVSYNFYPEHAELYSTLFYLTANIWKNNGVKMYRNKLWREKVKASYTHTNTHVYFAIYINDSRLNSLFLIKGLPSTLHYKIKKKNYLYKVTLIAKIVDVSLKFCHKGVMLN